MTRDEAIKILRGVHDKALFSVRNALETLIPELAENEDERVGNVIYCTIRDDKDVKRILEGNGVSVDSALTYLENLEKRKEQKLVTFEEPYNSDEYEAVEIGDATCLRRKEQKHTEQIEDDEEKSIGTTLIDALNGNARLEWELKRAGVNVQKLIAYLEQKPVEWNEEDRKMLNTIISDGSRGVEFDAKQVNFLKSLCPQYRWKLSEQEKGALRTAIHVLTEERNFPKATAHLQNILDAFEGEELRKDWRPSQEQMRAVFDASERNDMLGSILRNLYNDLKQL